jgi:hypothetical protein
VDAADVSIALLDWGQPGASDITKDGTTDAADVSIILLNWGACP